MGPRVVSRLALIDHLLHLQDIASKDTALLWIGRLPGHTGYPDGSLRAGPILCHTGVEALAPWSLLRGSS